MGTQRVIIVEPGQEPYITQIGESQEDIEQTVHGPVNMVYLGDGFCVFTNKQNQGLPFNRGVYGTFCITKGNQMNEEDPVKGLTEIEAQSVLKLLEELYQRDLQIRDFLYLMHSYKN